MPQGPAARLGDAVSPPHVPPVLTGKPALTVLIGFLPAWKGIPLAAGPALAATNASTESTLQTLETTAKVTQAAALAAAGTPGAPAAVAAATAARLAAETAKAAAAAANAASIAAAAATGASMHMCALPWPIPPHGPGVVIDGSPTVMIENSPACRLGDTIIEAIGPPNKIMMGCPTVIIGDSGGGAGGGGGGGGTAAGAGAGAGAAGAGGASGAPGAGAGTKTANGPFKTADEAARAALNAANPQSIKDNLEYSGLIYQGKDGGFYFTGPAKGTDQGANPLKDAPAPPGTKVVADYHTHGDYSTADPKTGKAVRTNDPSKDAFNSDNFSTQDKLDNKKQGYPGYLGTPSGTFRKFDPATGSDTTL